MSDWGTSENLVPNETPHKSRIDSDAPLEDETRTSIWNNTLKHIYENVIL